MINYQTITIDLQPDYREPVVQMYLSERDVGRPIQVNVLMQGQPYSFTAGTTVHIDLRKPSGHVVQVNGNYAVGSNVVLFNVVEQMAAEPGMCLTELSIVGDGQDPIGSKNWLTKVELSPMHAGDPSETWIEDLDELVQDAMEGHIDATLSIPGDAADAAAVGEELADLKSAIEEFEPLSDDVKNALLNCFANVVWVDEHGQDYYDALEDAFSGVYPKITVSYTPGSHIVFDDDTLNTLKPYLTVTYYETAGSAGVALGDNDYALSGDLSSGVSVVTATYNSLSASFTVDVATVFINGYSSLNTSSAGAHITPFILYKGIYTYDYTDRIVAIKGNFLSAGVLTIGYYTGDLTNGQAEDLSTNYTEVEVLTIPASGEQKIAFANPLQLAAGASLAIGKRSDTAMFKYGSNGDKGFYNTNYTNHTFRLTTGSSLGLDVYTA